MAFDVPVKRTRFKGLNTIPRGVGVERKAFQDLIPDNQCFGCGPYNPHGLQIKSFWDGEEAVCTFQPSPHHMAGPPSFLNGGITATIVDCHSVCTAIAHAYRTENRAIGSDPSIWCVTASLHIQYLRPIPIEPAVHLRARILETSGRRTKIACTVFSEGKDCAVAEVEAVRVAPEWRSAG